MPGSSGPKADRNLQQSPRKSLRLGDGEVARRRAHISVIKCGEEESKCTSYATDRIKRAVAKAQRCAFPRLFGISHSILLAIRLSFTQSLRKHFGGFAMTVRFRKLQPGLLLATALSVSMWSASGHAYTPEQQQACSGDAFRLCGYEIPDIERVTVCMIRNKSQLSPGCRAHFRPDQDAAVTESSRRQASDRPRRYRRDDD
jgi:hypothetical protein